MAERVWTVFDVPEELAAMVDIGLSCREIVKDIAHALRVPPPGATPSVPTLQQRLVELQNFIDALTRRHTLQGPVAATWALQGYRDLAITPPDDVVRAACELDDYEARRRWWEGFCAIKSA